MKSLCRHLFALFRRPSSIDANGSKEVTPKIDYALRNAECGNRDMKLDGWLNLESGELAPGFTITEKDHVLDVGCGSAGHSYFCLLQRAQVTFTDIDAGAVADAQCRFNKLGFGKAVGLVSDSNPLPIESNSISRIIAIEVLEHVDDPDAFLRELHRVGMPGALYLLTVPDAVSENMQRKIAVPAHFEKPNHIHILDHTQFAKLVTDAGLIIEEHKNYGAYWTLWWLFFWNTDVDLSAPNHPLLEAWTNTWNELLNTPDALRIKRVLDNHMPKTQMILARKP